MSKIDLSITNIKNIKSMEYSFPFEKGIYALAGENSCGKSTIMLALSLIVKTSSYKMLKKYDLSNDSKISISIDDVSDIWYVKRNMLTTGRTKLGTYSGRELVCNNIHKDGFYEGSIFYGSRFEDYNRVNKFLQKDNIKDFLIDADDFVKEKMGYILHNKKDYYPNLKKIKDKITAKDEGFSGMPYFIEINNNIISQYRMSSGESMLLSLIDFINNLVEKNKKETDKILFLIDEVELALHPAAVDRLVTFFNNLIKTSQRELVVYFSTHSSELLHRISHKNIFYIDNYDGKIDITNPCYPNYAIRNLYIPNGFDFIILVEDELAKNIVDKVIQDESLAQSKLCKVLPAGGWSQMLKLHHDMLEYNTLGFGKKIISIYDGDVKEEVVNKKEYSYLPKTFLPIPSIEKYLYKKCIEEKDRKFIKMIGDKYFTVRSLQDIINDYMENDKTKNNDKINRKGLYSVIISNLNKYGISEDSFIRCLCNDIFQFEDLSKFKETLSKLLN